MWVLAMKKSDSFKNRIWAVLAILLIIASPACLSLAMREIPVGTAYAVWTGIGAVGTVVLGVALFKEKVNLRGVFFISLIIIGAVGLGMGAS
jgi:quaternary ammonium compound-resistance protein SugE